MMESGDLRDDIKIPEGDIGTEIKTKFDNGEDLLVSSFPIICPESLNNGTTNPHRLMRSSICTA